MLKAHLKKLKEEGQKEQEKKKPSKDKPDNSDSDTDDDMDFKNLKVGSAPKRNSLNANQLPQGMAGASGPISPGRDGPPPPRQRRASFDSGSNAAMVKDAMKDVDKVLGQVSG